MEASAPQGIIPLPLNASAISHNAPQHPHKHSILPISKLTSELALASPDKHPQVCLLCFLLLSHLVLAIEIDMLTMSLRCELMADAWGKPLPTCGAAGASPCGQSYWDVAGDGPS